MTTKISEANIQASTLETIGGGGPKITQVIVTDYIYVATGATTVAPAGGYIKIIGSGFVSGVQVLIDETPATNITFIDSSTLQVALPAKSVGSYFIYVVNPDGGYTIAVNGISYQSVKASTVEYLVVAGGGGGGDRHGGGGGAGGYITASGFAVSLGAAITVTVGAGGTAGNYESGPTATGGRGGDSVFSNITANGGGGGGTYDSNPTGTFGSGGGGGGAGRPGIAGTAGQGNSGGSGANPGGGGGGGAGGVGGNANNGSGGVGLASSISGTSTYYAGGGGGGWGDSVGPATPGGLGGGGGGAWDEVTIQAGTVNTGGGGGASRSNASNTAGRAGGSGITIIRYPDTFEAAISTTGSPTITVSNGYRIYKFTSSGSITF